MTVLAVRREAVQDGAARTASAIPMVRTTMTRPSERSAFPALWSRAPTLPLRSVAKIRAWPCDCSRNRSLAVLHPTGAPAGVTTGGSSHAGTIHHVHARPTGFPDSNNLSVRLMEGCKWHSLCQWCHRQSKRNYHQPLHCCRSLLPPHLGEHNVCSGGFDADQIFFPVTGWRTVTLVGFPRRHSPLITETRCFPTASMLRVLCPLLAQSGSTGNYGAKNIHWFRRFLDNRCIVAGCSAYNCYDDF